MNLDVLSNAFIDWKVETNKRTAITTGVFLRHLNNLLEQKKGERFSPTQVSICITEQCDLNCIYCYQWRSNRIMEFKNIEKILYELKKNQVLELTITGGEPFLHPQWIEILTLAKKLGFILKVQSNGLALNKNKAKILKSILNSKTDSIQVSLDGSTPAVYHLQRNGNFDEVIKNIRDMVEIGLKVMLNITPTKENQEDIYNTFQLAGKLNVFGFGATPLAYLGKGDSSLIPSQETVIYQENLIISDQSSKVKYFGGVSGEILNLACIPEFNRKLEKFYVKERRNEFSCNGGHTKAHIDVNYDIYPCVFAQSDNLKLGNLLKKDFFDIWFNQYHTSEFFTVLRNLNDSKCQECNLINICGGGCPGMAYETHRSINYPDPRCCK